ncbi:MAG: Xaa-Pro peptidase family protein [Chloroflexi bacterium]|nr:Xaa-Pro peptidase family protein [Chloroflexota bacterium]
MTHVTSPAFSLTEYRARLAGVRAEMARQRLDSLLVSSPENIFYLSGYGTKGVFAFQMLLVPLEGDVALVTRRVELGNVQLVLADSLIELHETYGDTDSPTQVVVDVLGRLGLARGRVGVEKSNWFLTVQRFEELASGVSAEFVDATRIVEDLRLIKSPAELGYLRQAAAISERVASDGIRAVRAGTTDNAVAIAVLQGLVEHGSDYVATWPNIMAGRRSGLTHATWSNYTIQPGDSVCIEFAGVVHRYHAPVYRTVLVGEVSPALRRMADAVRGANDAGIAALRPGLSVGDIDSVQRRVVEEAGFGHLMGHRGGYSVGIGYPPTWAQTFGLNIVPGSDAVLQPGMVFHMAMYLFEPAMLGVGCSQTVAITETGHELLTQDEKGPFYV